MALWMYARRARRAIGESTCYYAAFIVAPFLRASRYATKWVSMPMAMAHFARPMNFSRFARIAELRAGVQPRMYELSICVRRQRAELLYSVSYLLVLWHCL